MGKLLFVKQFACVYVVINNLDTGGLDCDYGGNCGGHGGLLSGTL